MNMYIARKAGIGIVGWIKEMTAHLLELVLLGLLVLAGFGSLHLVLRCELQEGDVSVCAENVDMETERGRVRIACLKVKEAFSDDMMGDVCEAVCVWMRIQRGGMWMLMFDSW